MAPNPDIDFNTCLLLFSIIIVGFNWATLRSKVAFVLSKPDSSSATKFFNMLRCSTQDTRPRLTATEVIEAGITR
ncbi:hypothetical protein LX36DRAFT_659662 [Colletotrichum falcatum]|nr:hypothetical protein LX36DRAFT_659662 [Colletotrichum falcatum]